MTLITNQIPRWEITFRAANIPHVQDGTKMRREMGAADKASALVMFRSSPVYGLCEVLECKELFEDRLRSDNPNTDVSKPKLIKK